MALLNVLQDDGFIVKTAVVDLGLLTASKEVDVEKPASALFAKLMSGISARWKKNKIIETTTNVSAFGKQTRVRVNFQMKTLDNKGGVCEIRQIEDLNYYQEFFSKVEKGVFIQKEKL